MTTRAGPGHGRHYRETMRSTPIIHDARRPLGETTAECIAQNPDLAQSIEACTGDHGCTQMIEDCMNESARVLAASEARHQGVQE